MDILREPIKTKKNVIRCDGGQGILGHPVVFLNLGTEGKVVCPYCSKCYIKIIAHSTAAKKIKGLRRVSLKTR